MAPSRQTNPDEHGRYRVRDRKNRRSGTWSSRVFNPDTMLLIPNAAASDGYGKALPHKPWRPESPATPTEPPAPADEDTTHPEGTEK